MIQGIRFELKKYVMTKSHFVILLVITLAEMGMLFFNEGGYFVEKETRQKFYLNAEQNFSGTDKQDLIEESRQLDQELYKTNTDGLVVPDKEEMDKEGKYSDTRLDDYAFLNELITCMEVIEKRNRNTALLADTFEGDDYEKEDNHLLPADRKKLTAAVHNMSFGWVPCLALIILLSASYALEYENDINPVLCITEKGGWAVSLAKILTVLGAIITILYGAEEYGILASFFPIQYLDAPVQSISCLSGVWISASIGGWIAFTMGIRIGVIMLFSGILCTFLYFIKNKKTGILIMTAIVYIPMIVSEALQIDTYNVISKLITVYPLFM